MSNVSSFSSSDAPDIIPNECDPEFDPFWEILIYLGTFIYLGIGLFFHVSILKVILVTRKVAYRGSSFFQIFVLDSFSSILIILNEMFFNRLFMYIPPLCPIVSPFFWSPSIILKLVYLLITYGRFAKSIAQILMVLNRMSCVLQPTNYKRNWKLFTPVCYILVAILPFGGSWNILISRTFATNIRGGFTANYIKTVKWAALSLFQSIYILTALIFTIFCASITLYQLICLPNRIKAAEKSLCFTSIFISISFLLVAATQLPFYVCSTCDLDLLFILQTLAFDTFTVGSAAILISTNIQIRREIFSYDFKKDDRVFTMSVKLNTL